VWINNGTSNKFLPKNDAEKYLKNGWIKGAIKKDDFYKSEDRSKKISKAKKGKFLYSNGEVVIALFEEEYEKDYKQYGYYRASRNRDGKILRFSIDITNGY